MNILIILTMLVIHWISDFIFQAEKWSLKKSKEWSALLKHTTTYSLLWFLPIWFLSLDLVCSILFVLITFFFHTLTDYFTSKIVSKKFKDKHFGSPVPNFGAFTLIGLDQLLHHFQLFITWYVLFERSFFW